MGCGYLSDHKRYANTGDSIGIDIQKGTCDVLCSVYYLPFIDNVFSYVYARNILEHLNQPLKGIQEIKRVMKDKAIIDITIPIHHNVCIDELIKLIVGCPLRFYHSVKRLIRWRKNMKRIGFRHCNRIKPRDLESFFHIKEIIPIRFQHPINFIPPLCYTKFTIYLMPEIYRVIGKHTDEELTNG